MQYPFPLLPLGLWLLRDAGVTAGEPRFAQFGLSVLAGEAALFGRWLQLRDRCTVALLKTQRGEFCPCDWDTSPTWARTERSKSNCAGF